MMSGLFPLVISSKRRLDRKWSCKTGDNKTERETRKQEDPADRGISMDRPG